MSIDKEEIGKVVCSKCGGVGQFQSKNVKGICVKCLGEGKLDWIENVVGKKGFSIKPGVYVDGGIVMSKVIQDSIAKNFCKIIDRDIVDGINQEAQEQKHIKKGEKGRR